ncbi:DMT family transporter [Paractinoplanes atraurantiacus]|uniref:DMT family transporter n=1 Tax=Paractinoplanes atraurantiacus TaxID=1036182 RepID=UPI000BE2502F|nr:EamA family transporter [Actinoplanes atraurantiacus]
MSVTTRPAVLDHHVNPLAGPVPVLAAATLWGTTGTAASFAPSAAPAAAIGAAGLVLGGSLLFLTDLRPILRTGGPRGRALPRREWPLLLLGAVTVAGYPLSFYPAVARSGVAVATVITLGSAPVFAGLLAWLLQGARPARRWTVGTVAAIAGCAVLVLGPELTGGGAGMDVLGVALALVAGLSYAAYTMVGGNLIARGHPSGAVMGTMFGTAGLLVLPVVFAGGPSWLLSARGAAVAVYLALVPTYAAYRLFGYGLRHTTATTATVLSLAEAAVAALLGVVLLGERLPALSWAGLAVLTAGLAFLTLPARSRMLPARSRTFPARSRMRFDRSRPAEGRRPAS